MLLLQCQATRPFRLCLSATLLWLAVLPVAHAVDVLPSFEQVRSSWVASDAVLLDRNGEPLADLRLDPTARRLPWVSLQSLSPAMREALLAAEDKRFFEHSGIDWKAFIGAAWQNLWSKTRRGASTLTMQLAGMLDPDLRLPGRGTARRSVGQKWDQSFAALELERRWSKPQILEAYLNLVPFRGDLEGIGAASQLMFGLAPDALTRREAVILAALLRGPNAKAPVVTRRACALATVLNDKRLCPAVGRLVQARLNAPRNQPRFALAPHLARSLLREPGQQLRSTLDATQQRALLNTLAREPGPAWALLLDNTSGEVRAWAVQGLPADQPDPLTQAQRLSLWWAPFAAAQGIGERSHTAASLLIDGDTVLDANDARAGQRSRILSLRTALAAREAGALRSLRRELSSEGFSLYLRELGIELADNNEVSAQQLAIAWRSLASASSAVPARGLPLDAPQRRPMLQDAAFIVHDVLASPQPGVAGASSPQAQPVGHYSLWPMQSPDARLHMMLGSSDRYTLITGFSNATPRASAELLARQNQLRWQDAIAAVQKEPPRAPATNDHLINGIIAFEPPIEPARREWFIKGTEFSPVMAAALPYAARITFPQTGAGYRIDAIGSAAWALRADIARVGVRWSLDGKLIGQGAQTSWVPQLGRHQLRLLGPRDEVLDAVEFWVTP